VFLRVWIGNDPAVNLVTRVHQSSHPHMTLTSRLWTLYIKHEISLHGVLSQRPQGYASNNE